jgi:hypothetical protein
LNIEILLDSDLAAEKHGLLYEKYAPEAVVAVNVPVRNR